jgi:hypothetical protein
VIPDVLKGHSAFAMFGSTNAGTHHHIPGKLNQLHLSSGDKLHMKHLTSLKINFYEIGNTMAILFTVFRALLKYYDYKLRDVRKKSVWRKTLYLLNHT